MGSAEPVAYAYTRLLVIRGAGSISAAQTAVEFPLAAQRVAEEPLIGARGDAIDRLPRHTGGAGAREGDGCARVDQAVWRRCAAAFEAGGYLTLYEHMTPRAPPCSTDCLKAGR